MVMSIGVIETNSIPKGIEAGDAMLKAAEVQLVTAQPICAGKYIVIVSGEVAAVKSSTSAGREVAADTLVDELVIPNVHEDVAPAINACSEIGHVDAVGIIETFSLCSSILSADAAAKAADIKLMEVRLGRGLGGKSFVILTGDVAAVNASVRAAEAEQGTEGLIAKTVVIPSPHPDLIGSLM
ncbi:MAG: BMC domain-containing protein [Christensenellaceae bacterium]|nr:BMC domain-containing protein [Christensenellaceae bacterium]